LSRDLRVALIGIGSGYILLPLNSTMLAVALPEIMDDFDIGTPEATLLVTLYLVALAGALPFSGAIGDRIGHKKAFLLGAAMFGLTSIIGAVAWVYPVLVVSRVLQALSGALIGPNSQALIRAIAPEDRRGGSFGILGMMIGVAAATGPFIGGALTGGFGWRSLFVIAVPVAGTAVAIVYMSVKVTVEGAGDMGGGGIRTIFSSPVFVGAAAGVLLTTVILHATFILIPILTQQLMGMSPIASGSVLLGLAGVSAVVAPIAGRMSDRMGRRRPAMFGAVIMAGSTALLILASAEPAVWSVTAALAIMGFGIGLEGTPRNTAAVESVDVGLAARASSFFLTSRYVGGAIGAQLAGFILGDSATFAGVSTSFVILTGVAIAVIAVTFTLPTRALRKVSVPEPHAEPLD
jgi:DHA2 family methylenomycin A resistance protein-like MFS transporter